MSIIYETHVCNYPVANRGVGRFGLVPIYEKGTIWQCDECGVYWRYVTPLDFGDWRRVRFWNLIAKHRIRKATQ